MKRSALSGLALLSCLLAFLATRMQAAEPPQSAPDKPAADQFVRLDRDKSGQPLALQTAVVHYISRDPQRTGLTVDLVGAVHVGERSYYEALNGLFEKYDVVLYELVAPPGTRIPKGTKPGNHPVAMLQNGLKDMLALEHQLQYVDYTKENMIHADMSPDEFSKSMADRGESVVGMFFRLMGHGIAQQSKLQAQGKFTETDLLAALFDSDRARALKRVMAEQMENVGGFMEALEGPQGSTIISERNKVAMGKLAEQIKLGKTKIAIFYGAGHLPDMEKRLMADFRLQREGERWFTAWNLEKPPGK